MECSLLLVGYAEHGLSGFVDILDAVGGCTSQELMDVAESSLIMHSLRFILGFCDLSIVLSCPCHGSSIFNHSPSIRQNGFPRSATTSASCLARV